MCVLFIGIEIAADLLYHKHRKVNQSKQQGDT